MIILSALLLALADPVPATTEKSEPVAAQSQISLSEVGRAIAAGRLDQGQHAADAPA